MSEFTFGEFEELVHDFDEPLLVCFYKDGRMDDSYKHFIERLIKDIGDKVNIIKADITNSTEIQNAYDVCSSPELDVFYNGHKAWGFDCGIYSSEYVEHTIYFVKAREGLRVRDIDLCGTVLS